MKIIETFVSFFNNFLKNESDLKNKKILSNNNKNKKFDSKLIKKTKLIKNSNQNEGKLKSGNFSEIAKSKINENVKENLKDLKDPEKLKSNLSQSSKAELKEKIKNPDKMKENILNLEKASKNSKSKSPEGEKTNNISKVRNSEPKSIKKTDSDDTLNLVSAFSSPDGEKKSKQNTKSVKKDSSDLTKSAFKDIKPKSSEKEEKKKAELTDKFEIRKPIENSENKIEKIKTNKDSKIKDSKSNKENKTKVESKKDDKTKDSKLITKSKNVDSENKKTDPNLKFKSNKKEDKGINVKAPIDSKSTQKDKGSTSESDKSNAKKEKKSKKDKAPKQSSSTDLNASEMIKKDKKDKKNKKGNKDDKEIMKDTSTSVHEEIKPDVLLQVPNQEKVTSDTSSDKEHLGGDLPLMSMVELEKLLNIDDGLVCKMCDNLFNVCCNCGCMMDMDRLPTYSNRRCYPPRRRRKCRSVTVCRNKPPWNCKTVSHLTSSDSDSCSLSYRYTRRDRGFTCSPCSRIVCM